MSLAKKAGKSFGTALFMVALMTAISVNSLSQFTEYEKMKPMFVDIISIQLERQFPQTGVIESAEEEDEFYQLLSESCEGRESVEFPMDVAGGIVDIEKVTIDCNEFRLIREQNIPTSRYLAGVVAGSIFDSFYYRKYDCDFIQCMLQGERFVVVSAKGNAFFNSIKLLLWSGVAAGAVLLFVSCDTWADRLKGFGWPMTITGVAYFLIGVVKDSVMGSFPEIAEAEQAGIGVTRVVDMFMKPIVDALLVVLIIGVMLTISGYAVGYYQSRQKKKGPAPVKTKPTKKVEPKKKESKKK